MKVLMWATAAILTVSLTSGVSLAGGHPPKRSGLFFGFNLGAGEADITMTDEYDSYLSDRHDIDGKSGALASFRLGGALTNNVLLGVESCAWASEGNDITYTLTVMALAVTFYPYDRGFFLRGGIGFGTSDVSIGYGNGWELTKDNTRLGLIGAAGYEWRLSQKFALVPEVDLAYLHIGRGVIESASIIGATLGFGWYW